MLVPIPPTAAGDFRFCCGDPGATPYDDVYNESGIVLTNTDGETATKESAWIARYCPGSCYDELHQQQLADGLVSERRPLPPTAPA